MTETSQRSIRCDLCGRSHPVGNADVCPTPQLINMTVNGVRDCHLLTAETPHGPSVVLDLTAWPAGYDGPARFVLEGCKVEAIPGGGIKVTPLDA